MEKTDQIFLQLRLLQDHLHIRGENISVGMAKNALLGSPPHTWRKPSQQVSHLRAFRITSTYVEKTLSVTAKDAAGEDHLHIRGENPLHP